MVGNVNTQRARDMETALKMVSPSAMVRYRIETPETDAEFQVTVDGVEKYGIQVCSFGSGTCVFAVNEYEYDKSGELESMIDMGGFRRISAAFDKVMSLVKEGY